MLRERCGVDAAAAAAHHKRLRRVQRRDAGWLRLLAAAAGTFVREGLRVGAKDDGNEEGESVHGRPAAGSWFHPAWRGLMSNAVPLLNGQSQVFRNRLPRND
jgi:hypothetical protein